MLPVFFVFTIHAPFIFTIRSSLSALLADLALISTWQSAWSKLSFTDVPFFLSCWVNAIRKSDCFSPSFQKPALDAAERSAFTGLKPLIDGVVPSVLNARVTPVGMTSVLVLSLWSWENVYAQKRALVVATGHDTLWSSFQMPPSLSALRELLVAFSPAVDEPIM